jgi:hypothetical protein
MIMSVGYKPYVKSEFRTCRSNTFEVLTATPAMAMKPGSRNTPKTEIAYKTCDSAVNHSVIFDASRSGTYPNTAINETGLDEQSENPIDLHRSTSIRQMYLYWTTAFPTQSTKSEIVVRRRLRKKSSHQAFQAINPVESRLVASVGRTTNSRARSPTLPGSSILRLAVPNTGMRLK